MERSRLARRRWPAWLAPAALVGVALTLAADPLRDPPETPYTGTLQVEFICSMPPFASAAAVDVEVAGDGAVDFGFTTMEYGGSIELEGGCVYERQGSWEIVPLGTYESGPPAHLAVDENIAWNEQITLTCPDYTIDGSDSGNLNGGLAFDITEAVVQGAVVEVTTENGDCIRWTLHLTPGMAAAATSWSRLKARYGG